jgi:hypothetical protein
MTRSRPLILEQLEDRTAPAVLAAPGAYLDTDADLHPPPVQTFVTGTLGAAAGADGRLLDVVDGQQFHFILSAPGAGAPGGAGVQMTITDPAGRLAFALTAADGTTWAGDVFLNAGAYQVTFTATGAGGAPGTVGFELSGWGLWGWGWLGPQLNDTTQQPLEPSAAAALPAPASFFFLPENVTDLAAALISRGPSFQLAGASSAAGPGGGLASVQLLSPAAPPASSNLPLAGVAVRRDVDVGHGEPVATAAPPEVLPAAVTHGVGGNALMASFAAELSPRDGPASFADSGTILAPQPGPVVTAVTGADGATESPPAAGPAQVGGARVLWVLGLGSVILTSLALPARWCAVLVPQRLRFAVRRRREMVPST